MSKPHRVHTLDEDENDGTRVRRRQRLDEARTTDTDDEFDATEEFKIEHDEQEAPSQTTILGSDYLPLGNGCYIRRSHPPAE
jgi:hypothetical protein